MQITRHYASVWLVGIGYLLMLLIGVVIAYTYYDLLADINKNSAEIDRITAKSAALEDMIFISRERSILLVTALAEDDEFKLDQLRQQFDALITLFAKTRGNYVNQIMQHRADEQAVAIAEQEVRLMERYLQELVISRDMQNELFEAVQAGQREDVVKRLVAESLPQQKNAMDVLRQLQGLNQQDRDYTNRRLEHLLHENKEFLWRSSAIYLLALFLVAFVTVRKLYRVQRAQLHFNALLEEKIQKRTQDYEQANGSLEQVANYDVVTGLPNRYQFQRVLDSYVDAGYPFSLFFIDLDNFKWFNDTQGHDAGDQLLRRVADMLREQINQSPEVFLARIGGDEFVLLCRNFRVEQDSVMAQEMIEAVKRLDFLNCPSKSLGFSIGIARYPEHGETRDDLLKHADFAMYRAKDNGKNRYFFFSDEMRLQITHYLMMERALSEAIVAGEFQVYYQAQYRLSDLSLTGAEALLRWYHAGNFVSPVDFIPIAEKTGLIHELGLFVLSQSVAQLVAWQAQGHALDKIAVNLSPIQMRFTQVVQQIQDIIHDAGVGYHRVDFEVTESTFMEEMEASQHVLVALQSLGMEISLDDFGTGYSSLSHIKQLNVDRIKIDKSFIRDIAHDEQSRILVKAIITMTHSMGLIVLAEGIETQAQYDLLKALGCDEGQGYLFAKPVAADYFSFERPF